MADPQSVQIDLPPYEGRGNLKRPADSLYDGGLPTYESPRYYFASSDLADAVNTAIFLRQPLLLTGAPGTGKTQLAHSIAWEFGLPLQIFNTKMNSTGPDLFYRYDSLLHFHDSHDPARQPDASKYVTFAALGKAIIRSWPRSQMKSFLPPGAMPEHKDPTRSVVLIDEIDKAPRDFPNDILYETERLKFEVKETNWAPFSVNEDLCPIIIVTSNQERNLPEAFLRRCVFFYIPPPDEATLRDIVHRRLLAGVNDPTGSTSGDGKAALPGPEGKVYDAALKRFMAIQQDTALLKNPATAEMLAWMRVLVRNGLTPEEIAAGGARLRSTLGVLAKSKDDLQRLQARLAPGSS